jgi:hypothetical protein
MSHRLCLGTILTVTGFALLLHHGITAGIIFDTNDFIGHDWLGIGLMLVGALAFYTSLNHKKRGKYKN